MTLEKFGMADLKSISQYEIKYGIKLPSDYIEFLLKYNGGNVEPDEKNAYYVEALKGEINIDVLFGVGIKDHKLSVDFWTNKYKNEMPDGTIIIGDSYQHGFFVLLCFGEDAGVYYWDDTYHYSCSNDESNTYFIADTFTDFIKQIK